MVAGGCDRWSAASWVRSMKACSNETVCGVSSHSVIPWAAATAPMWADSAPRTRSSWSGAVGSVEAVVCVMSEVVVVPLVVVATAVMSTRGAAKCARSSSGCGVTTFTDAPPAWRTSSSTVVSARRRPRPMTIKWLAVRAISLIRWEETSTVRPSAARDLSRVRIQSTPSGSRPLTGSSRMTVAGSPRSAAAMPRRCPMPREKPLTLRWAAPVRPARAMTSSTRARGMPWVWASARRWLRADRPGWTERASSRAPTWVRGARWAA